jgi:putative enterotoxin type A
MIIDDYIRKQNESLIFFKNAAENLKELCEEMKEENDKYDEQQMEKMCKYYENGGLIK